MNRFERIAFRSALVLVLFVAVGYLASDTLNIPNTFSTGEVITAAKFNSNYAAIESVINGTLSDVNLKNDGITASSKIINETIDLAAMATSSVNSAKIVDESIASVDILNGTIATEDLAAKSVVNIVAATSTVSGEPPNTYTIDHATIDIDTQAGTAGPVLITAGPFSVENCGSNHLDARLWRENSTELHEWQLKDSSNSSAAMTITLVFLDEDPPDGTTVTYDIQFKATSSAACTIFADHSTQIIAQEFRNQ